MLPMQQQQQQMRHLGRPRVSTSLPVTSLGLDSLSQPQPLQHQRHSRHRHLQRGQHDAGDDYNSGGPQTPMEFRASMHHRSSHLQHQGRNGRYGGSPQLYRPAAVLNQAAAGKLLHHHPPHPPHHPNHHHHHPHRRRSSSRPRSQAVSAKKSGNRSGVGYYYQQARFPVTSMTAAADDATQSTSSPPSQPQPQEPPSQPVDETEARLLLIRQKLNQISLQQEQAEREEAQRQRLRQGRRAGGGGRQSSTLPVRARLVPSLQRPPLPPQLLAKKQPSQGLRQADGQEGDGEIEEDSVDDEDGNEEEVDDDDEENVEGDFEADGDTELEDDAMNCLDDDDMLSGCGSIVDSALASRRHSASVASAGVAAVGPRQPAVISSLFPNVPPVLRFAAESDTPPAPLPWAQRRQLKWRMSSITPVVVKRAVARSGFRVAKKSHEWLGYFGKHMKPEGFKGVREYQKVNHFPGSFTIGRKDRLWRALHRMQCQHGRREFDFFPLTYCLPGDLRQLKRAWEDAGTKQKWIVKPPASARGIGVRVVNKWQQVPKRRSAVVQTYLSRPYLIKGSKFDLRVYVCVTSFDPLRVYVHERGLVRFASVQYSRSSKTINNRFMHLTNYSVNKRNAGYANGDAEKDGEGHKWTLRALWTHLRQAGRDPEAVWDSVKDLVVKTIISGEAHINSQVKAYCRRRYCVHELFGFDVLLDEQLKPWLLEVNISPSLHSNSPLDVEVKSAMVRDFLNLAGYQLPEPSSSSSSASAAPSPGAEEAGTLSKSPYADRRCWPERPLSSDERAKKLWFSQQRAADDSNRGGGCSILDPLTPDDTRVLVESLDEFARAGEFQRVFPAQDEATGRRYLAFLEQPRYYNLLLLHYLARYRGCEAQGVECLAALCRRRLHLEAPTTDPAHHWSPPQRRF